MYTTLTFSTRLHFLSFRKNTIYFFGILLSSLLFTNVIISQDCRFTVDLGNDIFICQNDQTNSGSIKESLNKLKSNSITATIIGDSDTYSYLWSTGETTSGISVNPTSNTTYTLTVTDLGGCEISASVAVNIIEFPDLVLSEVASSCTVDDGKILIDNPTDALLNDIELSIDGGISYQNIYFEDAGLIDFEGLSEGLYEVWIRNSEDCGKFLENVEISCGAIASVCDLEANIGENLVICSDGTPSSDITLTTGANSSVSLNGQVWSTGETTESITVNPERSGFYSVTVYDSNGCEASDEIFVEVCTIPTLSLIETCVNNSGAVVFTSEDSNVEIAFLEFSFDDAVSWQTGIVDDAGNLFFVNIQDGNHMVWARCSSDSCPIFVGGINITCETPTSSLLSCYTLFEESVETSSQYWFLGGPDASIAQDEAFTGSNSFKIRDNSGVASSIFSTPFPVNFASTIEVSFAFLAVSMEFQESFSLELSIDGGSYTSVKTWESGADFANDQWMATTENVTIPNGASFASIRLICDASSNFDMIFIDDIIIGVCFEPNSGGAIPFVKTQDFSSLELEKEEIIPTQADMNISVYPNPSTDFIGFSFQNADKRVNGLTIDIYDVDGKKLINQVLGDVNERIDVNQLPKERMYIITATNADTNLHKVLRFYKK